MAEAVKRPDHDGTFVLEGFWLWALITAVVVPQIVLVIWIIQSIESYPEKVAAEVASYRKTVVGNCIDVAPIKEGKVVDVFDNGEMQVKIVLTSENGSQSMMLMPLNLALRNIVTCARK